MFEYYCCSLEVKQALRVRIFESAQKMPLLTIGTSLRQTADGEHNLKSLVTVDFVGLLVQDQGAGNKDPSDEMQNTPQKRKREERERQKKENEKGNPSHSQAAFIFTSLGSLICIWECIAICSFVTLF